jgi:hypothetical protein
MSGIGPKIAAVAVVSVIIIILIIVWSRQSQSLIYSILLIVVVITIDLFVLGVAVWKFLRNLVGLALIVSVASALFISTASYLEGPPRNNQQTSTAFADMTVFIDRVSPLEIPIRNYFERETTNVTVTVYPNSTEKITFESLTLNMSDSSVLHQNSGFKNITKDEDANRKRVYQTSLTVPHNMAIGNTTSQYEIIVSYFKGNSSNLIQHTIPFDWTITTMNLNIVIYFTIVMIGVLISRIITLLLKKIKENKDALTPPQLKVKIVNISKLPDNEVEQRIKDELKLNVKVDDLIKISPSDGLWILFSFVISVLIFGAFNEQDLLGPSVLVNIVLAFGFGFGFEKVLEVAARFSDLV